MRTHACMHVSHLYIYIYTYIFVCVCLCIYIDTYLYINIHTYIYMYYVSSYVILILFFKIKKIILNKLPGMPR
jgi:hypothetical protein